MLKERINDYVVTSRVRLARNVEGYAFPHLQAREEALRLLDEVSAPLARSAFTVTAIQALSVPERESLKERHLISQNLIDNAAQSGLALDKSERLAVMIGEEDHIRIQAIHKGFDLDAAYAAATGVDDTLSQSCALSYDERLGYLTACPTNLGTGMRASVMMFLPALSILRTIGRLPELLSRQTLTLRGVYGEGSDTRGFLYQLSNQYTLGLSEQEILRRVTENIYQIAEYEEDARQRLLAHNRTRQTDAAMRAYGILGNAYSMSSDEFMRLFAEVKLGQCLGLLPRPAADLDALVSAVQPGSITLRAGRELTEEERDIRRAEYVRKAINQDSYN
ncbi:MAG: ATP--guanido phosphotransferase [Clostridiales bacterium]|jgi:protein arginine kinase|nr:ATP--guanido phosphotransferase [Clostridiales bacterium]